MQQISDSRCKVPKSREGQDKTIPGERTLAHSTQDDKDRTIPGERTLAHSTQEDRMVIGLDGTKTGHILASACLHREGQSLLHHQMQYVNHLLLVGDEVALGLDHHFQLLYDTLVRPER